ncbi:MAG: hypothetical protein AB8B72_14770 [Crocinitomicaceae bacterium]
MITLRWVKAYPNESIDNAVTGLQWALSQVGARNIESSIVQQNELKMQIDVSKMGFSPQAITQFEILHNKIKLSEAYQENFSVDLGRYIALIIGASEHYYKIVGQPIKYTDLIKSYKLTDKPGFINESSVSPKDRLIRFSGQIDFDQLYVAEELDKMTGELLEIETFDLMENGQLRFAIYDKEGNRVPSADPKKSNAGKPAKCMWCHESSIQPLFANQNDYPGFLTYLELKDTLEFYKSKHEMNQVALVGGVNYADKIVHEEMELLYISFMEPSLARLMNEWNMSEDEVKETVSELETHIYPEFSFLGDLYHREDVEKLAPYAVLPTSSSVRETSVIEVNHLN